MPTSASDRRTSGLGRRRVPMRFRNGATSPCLEVQDLPFELTDRVRGRQFSGDVGVRTCLREASEFADRREGGAQIVSALPWLLGSLAARSRSDRTQEPLCAALSSGVGRGAFLSGASPEEGRPRATRYSSFRMRSISCAAASSSLATRLAALFAEPEGSFAAVWAFATRRFERRADASARSRAARLVSWRIWSTGSPEGVAAAGGTPVEANPQAGHTFAFAASSFPHWAQNMGATPCPVSVRSYLRLTPTAGGDARSVHREGNRPPVGRPGGRSDPVGPSSSTSGAGWSRRRDSKSCDGLGTDLWWPSWSGRAAEAIVVGAGTPYGRAKSHRGVVRSPEGPVRGPTPLRSVAGRTGALVETGESDGVELVDLAPEERARAIPVLEEGFVGVYRWHAKRTLRSVSWVRAAVAHGDVVGVAMLEPLVPGVGYVYYLAVARAARRRGVGGRLLDDALTRFASEGIRIVYGAVEAENLPSRRVFETRGFRLIERSELNYRDGGLGAEGLRSRMWVVRGEVLFGRRLSGERSGPIA